MVPNLILPKNYAFNVIPEDEKRILQATTTVKNPTSSVLYGNPEELRLDLQSEIDVNAQ
jgi:hypothetical protein